MAGSGPKSSGQYLLLHYYGARNRGDLWIVEATRSLLGSAWSEVSLAALPENVGEADFLPPWLATPRGPLRTFLRSLTVSAAIWLLPVRIVRHAIGRELVEAIMSSNLAISKGGSFVLTRGAGVGSWWYLLQVLTPLRLIQRFSVPSVIAGQSIGPFACHLQQRLAVWVLERCNRVLMRDPRSLELVKNSVLVPDVVLSADTNLFGLPSSCNDASAPNGVSGKYLAVSLVGATYIDALPHNFLEQFADAVAATAHGCNFRVVLFTQVTGPTVDDDDRPSLRKLESALQERGVDATTTDPRPTSVRVLQGAEAVITCRMHTGIASIVLGTPVIFVSYLSPKTEGVRRAVNGGVRFIDGASFDRTELALALESVMASGEKPSAGLAAKRWREEVAIWKSDIARY